MLVWYDMIMSKKHSILKRDFINGKKIMIWNEITKPKAPEINQRNVKINLPSKLSMDFHCNLLILSDKCTFLCKYCTFNWFFVDTCSSLFSICVSKYFENSINEHQRYEKNYITLMPVSLNSLNCNTDGLDNSLN